MTIPKIVIEKALSAGWQPPNLELQHNAVFALDPDFWVALGKALGWNTSRYEPIVKERYEWEGNAHRFYDLILIGGDTEKFWQELLGEKSI